MPRSRFNPCCAWLILVGILNSFLKSLKELRLGTASTFAIPRLGLIVERPRDAVWGGVVALIDLGVTGERIGIRDLGLEAGGERRDGDGDADEGAVIGSTEEVGETGERKRSAC